MVLTLRDRPGSSRLRDAPEHPEEGYINQFVAEINPNEMVASCYALQHRLCLTSLQTT